MKTIPNKMFFLAYTHILTPNRVQFESLFSKTKFCTDIIFKMAAPSFIDSGYELFSFNGLLNLNCCQHPFTNVLFFSKVGIIRNEI